jgi:hypothetical protein
MIAPVRWLTAFGFALVAACSRQATDPAASPSTNAALGVPPGPPSFSGVVAAVESDGRVLLERRPAPSDCAGRAVATLGPETRVIRRNGAAATAADVTVGQAVSAWFTGPELRSCPVQVQAAVIVLEPAGH